MTLPQTDAHALERYGVRLIPSISHWKDQLARSCEAGCGPEPLVQLLYSDVLDTQVFQALCRDVEAARAVNASWFLDAISPLALLALMDCVSRHGFGVEIQHLVDKLVAS